MLTAADCQAVSVLPDPPHVGTFGVLMRIEHGQWIASIGGFEGVHPPKDDTKLLEWCEQVCRHFLLQASGLEAAMPEVDCGDCVASLL